MRTIIICLSLLCLSACARTATSPLSSISAADLKAQIDANNAAWSAAANRGDATAVAAMYTENATMLPPGADMQIGRAAIEATVKKLGGTGIKDFALQAINVTQVGPDTAREIGRFSLRAPAPHRKWVTVEGKYVVIWKLVGGKWLLDTDIWNMNK
jgi:uncharacterized protein (TIGR02246 family)